MDGSTVTIARLGTQNHGAMPGLRKSRDHDEHHVGNNNGISLWRIPPIDDAPSRPGALEKPRRTAMAVVRGLKRCTHSRKARALGIGEEIAVLLKR